MKKRLLSMVLTVIMLVSLIPTSVFAAKKSVDDYFDGLPIAADPGTGTTAWKVSTKDGEEVLMSGNAGKNYSSSTLTLTFTEDTHLTFEYKVSSEAKYDKCTITLGSNTLVNGVSGDQEWKGLELDAKRGDKLTVLYKKDSSGDKFDDCVYLRNFSAGEALVVTFHANNGTEDTATQKIFGGKGTLKANTFTCEGKIFAGWATSADGAVVYEDGAAITTETDLDLYAVWSDAYTVTLRNGDTDTTVLVPQNSAIGSRIPADPTKKGYTFEGWFNGEEKLTAETVISGDVIYTAQWSPITYTIAFSGGEGGQGAMDSIPATYDQEVTLPKNTFTRPGYYFNGWSASSGTSSGSYADEKPVKNLTTKQGETVTLYAAWYGLPVNVTLHPNYDGAENGTRTCIVGSNYNYILKEGGGTKFDAIEDPVRTGYIFDGWFDAAEGGNAVGPSYKFTAVDAENGFHLYAHWTKGITVHFDGNGYKNTLKDKTVTPDKVFSSLPSLSSYYYPANKALDGWYIKNADGSFGEAVTKDTVFSGDEVTLIAKWRDYQYIIKYNVKYSDKNTTTGYKFIRNMDSYNAVGVKADEIPGWYDAQQYRCFRSSNSAVVAHETLRVTQPKYNTHITVDSLLTYTQYAKYYEKFQGNADYEQFAQFYKQPISTTVTVIGTEGIEDPNLQPLTVTVNVEGSTFKEDFTDLEGATYTCSTGDHRTAADAVMAALTENQYTYTGSSTYLSGITDPNSVSLTGGDSAFGSWSGWMFTVNGEMPIERYDNGQPIYATLGTYQLKDGDVVRMYYVACPTESGQHTWDDGQVTTAATCTENGVMTYTCTMCGDTKTEVIPATGHAYGAPVWKWNDDFTASATFTCTNDATHVENVTAEVTSAVTTPAACETTGVRTYTAKVTFMDKEYTSSKTEVIPAAGHTLTAVAEVPATCETAGTSAHWKCDVCGKLFSDAESKTETTLEKLAIPATGHAYGAPVWKWNDDFTASATFTCGNDTSHVEKVDATVTSEVTEGSCEVGGTRTYTAKVTFEGKEYTDTKTEPIPAKGHTLTAVAEVPATCETAGVKAHWKCEVCGKLFSDAEGKTETTLEKLTIPATGHAYGAPVWKWNDDFTASATFTCGNDASHVETVNAAVTNEVTTAATCKADGVRTYTAKVTFEGKDYTDTKTEVIPATDHDTELVGAKDATCTEDGYTGDEVCKVCQTVVKQGEVIPALGHDYKDGKCSRCGAEEPTTPVEPGKPQQPEKPTTPDTPATGDESQLMLWVSGMLVCALGAGLMLRRKKEN